MLRRTLPWPAGKCQCRLTAPNALRRRPAWPAGNAAVRAATQLRSLSAATSSPSLPEGVDPAILDRSLPIRRRLRLWQEKCGGPSDDELHAFENYNLRDDISNGMNTVRGGSKADEHQAQPHEEDDGGDEVITLGLFLKPGDVVELSSQDREPVLAVFVQQLDMQGQFYSANGRWCHSLVHTVTFAIPGGIDPALLQPMIPYLPTRPDEAPLKGTLQVPPEVGAPVLKFLSSLAQESEKIYRDHSTVLDDAYSTLADQTRSRMMTLNQIAKTLLAPQNPQFSPSAGALLAVRKALNHNRFQFLSDARNQRLTNIFTLRPKDDVKRVETVLQWVRQFEEHRALQANAAPNTLPIPSEGAIFIANFAEKAGRLIAKSREHRDPVCGTVGPSKNFAPPNGKPSFFRTNWGEKFTTEDQEIIKFIEAWTLMGKFKGMFDLYAACYTILHAVGVYDIPGAPGSLNSLPLEKGTGYQFLQEIGVIGPYENRAVYDEQLMLPGIRVSRNMELLQRKTEQTRLNPDFHDSMIDLRRDWGTLEVYCIDDAGAKEIDDGVSISKVDGTPSEYWVHVHVANPTAFFDKTHVLSGFAAHMTETVYMPERTFPMIPSWAAQDHFSISKNRPVLTFSTRLDLSGAVLETKIQSGTVQRVTSITPAEVAEYLGESQTTAAAGFVVGGEIPTSTAPPRTRPDLSPSQIQDLRDLYTVARSLWAVRKAAGAVRMDSAQLQTRVFEAPGQSGLSWLPPSTDRTRIIHGDPVIEVTGKPAQETDDDGIHATDIVEEMMIRGCQTAGEWCAERNIPVMYRGTIETPHSSFTLDHFTEKIMKPYLEKHGRLSRSLEYLHRDALGRAIAHYQPIPHRIIGAQSYVKVTSPLRRFSDMIAHWQIEAALRYEARTGRKCDVADTTVVPLPSLPFSQEQMRASIITLSPREKIIKNVKAGSTYHWAVMAFMRALYYKEAKLPDTFAVNIRDLHGFATLKDYGIRVSVSIPLELEVEVGDEWEARIVELNPYDRDIHVELVRLLSREDKWEELD